MKRPAELPVAIRKKQLTMLQDALARGETLSSFTQEQRDLLHMETKEANVAYWTSEIEAAADDDAPRIRKCLSIKMSIVAALRALEPIVDDNEHPHAQLLMDALDETHMLSAIG